MITDTERDSIIRQVEDVKDKQNESAEMATMLEKNIYYVLDENENPKRCDVLTWAKWFERTRGKIIADSVIYEKAYEKAIAIRTIFTGINKFNINPPAVYETIIIGGERDGECESYCSPIQALEGHYKIVEELKEMP